MPDDKTEKKSDKNEKNFDELLDFYNEQNRENSFEYLLESYSDGMKDDLKVGDKISAEIIAIGNDTIYVDTKTKVDGAVVKSELLDEEGEFLYKNGDVLDLYVVSMSESEIVLSKAMSGIGGINMLREAYENNVPIDGKVIELCKGGFNVEVLKRRSFCPVSQIDVKYVENQEDYTGKTFQFLIIQFENNGKNIVVSRRKLLDKDLEEIRKKFYDELSVGNIHDGSVTNVKPYGVFVELVQGIEGLVHISEMSWSKTSKPEDIFKTGDQVKVKVIGIEEDKGAVPSKISLSIKQMEDDPWCSAKDRFQVGSTVTGTVTRCVKFGAFVEIAPGIEGLVHISEMSYVERVLKPENVVKPGETISVVIKDIDNDKNRVSLSIRDAVGDPWVDIHEKFSIGKSVRGTIEKKEKFGFFIKLTAGITGLLPKSKISKSYDSSAFEKKTEGESITVKIEEIDTAKRRISLDVADSVDAGEWKAFTEEKESSVGSLGEKLQKALEARKKMD